MPFDVITRHVYQSARPRNYSAQPPNIRVEAPVNAEPVLRMPAALPFTVTAAGSPATV